MAGWFKVNRDIQKHEIWRSVEPFDKRSAWIDLIMLANYKDFKTIKGNRKVVRKRGEVNTSYRFLADRWHWSKTRVVNYLKYLEEDSMVTLTSTAEGTVITIVNYGKYQDARDTKKDTFKDTTEDTFKDTTEDNDKEGIKESINNIINKGEEGKGRYPFRFLKDDDEIPGTEGL